jgi:hypothetical protein
MTNFVIKSKSNEVTSGSNGIGGALVGKIPMPDFSAQAKSASNAQPPASGSAIWGLIVDLTASRNESRDRLLGDQDAQASSVDLLFGFVGKLVTAYFRGNHGATTQVFEKSALGDNASPIKTFLRASCESGSTEIAKTICDVLLRAEADEKVNIVLILDTADGDELNTITGKTVDNILEVAQQGKGAALHIIHDNHDSSEVDPIGWTGNWQT